MWYAFHDHWTLIHQEATLTQPPKTDSAITYSLAKGASHDLRFVAGKSHARTTCRGNTGCHLSSLRRNMSTWIQVWEIQRTHPSRRVKVMRTCNFTCQSTTIDNQAAETLQVNRMRCHRGDRSNRTLREADRYMGWPAHDYRGSAGPQLHKLNNGTQHRRAACITPGKLGINCHIWTTAMFGLGCMLDLCHTSRCIS